MGKRTRIIAAAAYELLAFSFSYPNDDLAEAVISGEWQEATEEIADACGLMLPDKWVSGFELYGEKGIQETLRMLRKEATRLFVGAPDPAVSPYEGVWKAKDDGIQVLIFVNPYSMAVERFMRSCGVGNPVGKNEPLDHIATECEFMQYLASQEAGILELPEAIQADAFPGGSPRAASQQFSREHLQSWGPRFAKAIIDETKEPFYRSSASFLEMYLNHECKTS